MLEGAQHTEYELRTVRKLLHADFAGKGRLLLTGVLDLVVQQEEPLTYERTWNWTTIGNLEGKSSRLPTSASHGDLEIWDYKATRAKTPYTVDYVRQLLTYAALYRDRVGQLAKRCVLFFINEPPGRQTRLLAIPIDEQIIEQALSWTLDQVKSLHATVLRFEKDPLSVDGGSAHLMDKPIGKRTNDELSQQCTACGRRFDCGRIRGLSGKEEPSRHTARQRFQKLDTWLWMGTVPELGLGSGSRNVFMFGMNIACLDMYDGGQPKWQPVRRRAGDSGQASRAIERRAHGQHSGAKA